MNKFFDKFTLKELVTCAVVAALGIAIKPIIIPLAHIVCGPLMIPSGALAGGLYMMWLVIGYGLIKKTGSAIIISAIQALVVVFTGIIGSHGIMSFVTYLLPGLTAEIVFAFDRNRKCGKLISIIACTLANITGTATVNVVFFQVPGIYLLLILSISAISGIAGGVISDKLIRTFEKNEKYIISAWVDDIDNVDESYILEEAQICDSRKSGKIISVILIILICTAGIAALINYQSSDKDAENLIINIDGNYYTSYEMDEIKQLESETIRVNLSSTSNDDAIGDFKGIRLSSLLSSAGFKIVSDENIIELDGEIYKAAVISASDGYSSAAEADETESVLIAYEKDGDSLGYYKHGGTGPLRTIFTEDTYANRSVMCTVKINLVK